MKQTIHSDPAPVYAGTPGRDPTLHIRNGRPDAAAPEPQPDVAALLAQLIEGQAEIHRRLDAIEAAQERTTARLGDVEYSAGIAEDVRILVDQTVIPYVQHIAKCASNVEDIVIEIADTVAPLDPEDGADVVLFTSPADNADTTEEPS